MENKTLPWNKETDTRAGDEVLPALLLLLLILWVALLVLLWTLPLFKNWATCGWESGSIVLLWFGVWFCLFLLRGLYRFYLWVISNGIHGNDPLELPFWQTQLYQPLQCRVIPLVIVLVYVVVDNCQMESLLWMLNWNS